MATPKKNTEFTIPPFRLFSRDTGLALSAPTLEEGDFQVSLDAGAVADMETLPILIVNGGGFVSATLSADEMNGGNVSVLIEDASGEEWNSLDILIDIPDTHIDDVTIDIGDITTDIDDVATNVTEMWQMRGLDIANPLTTTKEKFTSGDIELDVTGDGVSTTTLTRV